MLVLFNIFAHFHNHIVDFISLNVFKVKYGIQDQFLVAGFCFLLIITIVG